MDEVRASGTVFVADSVGIRPVATTTDLPALLATVDFFWLDVSVGDEAMRTDGLTQLGLEPSDMAWALRFGQLPGMVIDRRGLRAVTWVAEPSGHATEVHVLGAQRCLLTVWSGDGAALTQAREHFAERAAELKRSHFQAVAVVPQLLLGTVNDAISTLDTRLHALRQQLRAGTAAVEFTTVCQPSCCVQPTAQEQGAARFDGPPWGARLSGGSRSLSGVCRGSVSVGLRRPGGQTRGRLG